MRCLGMRKPAAKENEMIKASREPRLSINLDEDTTPQLEALITVDLVEKVAALADLDDCGAKQHELRQGIITASDAYIQGDLDRQNQRSEKLDNEALDRVTRSAQVLYDALLTLQEYPGIEPRLEQAIRQNHHLYSSKEGLDLSKIINTRRNIFSEFREILVDLQVCAESEINRRPKPSVIEPIAEGDQSIQLETQDELDAGERKWRARSQARKIPKDHALQEFLRAFRPVWEGLTEHPFTEGMHYAETGETVSRLVDCVDIVFCRLAPSTERQEIVTALRKIRCDC